MYQKYSTPIIRYRIPPCQNTLSTTLQMPKKIEITIEKYPNIKPEEHTQKIILTNLIYTKNIAIRESEQI